MIRNIIFDLGVVLLDVNYSDTIRAFSDLGLRNAEEAFSKHRQDEFFRRYERGLMSSDEFLMGLAKRMKLANHDLLRSAWCEMLGELPLYKFELLQKLSKSHKLFVLSNTNEIHQEWFERKIDEQFGWTGFQKCFEFIGYSHQINERKPDPKAFLTILDQFGLEANQTLFIDDTLEHVESAGRLDIQTLHYSDGDDLDRLIMTTLEEGSIFS